MDKHILLIGMPGSGKSTIGKLLASTLQVPFIDTDVLIESEYGLPLEQIVSELGHTAFLDKEAAVIDETLQSNTPTVIAPGGSIAYHTSLIERIKGHTHCVFIDVPLDTLEQRIGTTPRGIVNPGGSFADLYNERIPLYQQFSPIVVDGTYTPEEIVRNIVSHI